MQFFDKPVREAVRSIAAGEQSCADVVDRSLERIAAGDGELHSFISTDPQGARARAAELDRLDPARKRAMPLLGMPVAVKDNICTKGIATTCASKMLEGFVPPYDAGVVEALTDAGAVIVGKANLDEFAMGSTTANSYFGPTRNPVDPDRIPGGSSGGSAAAVAAGFVPLALGSDTGGSIRQPCSHCGCAGLKPTYGRVSRYGLVAFASSLDQIGPVATDVRDLGTLLSVISRPDPRDSTNGGKAFIDADSLYTQNLSGVRIGLPAEYFGAGLSAGVRGRMDAVAAVLKECGATIVDVTLPHMAMAVSAYYVICTAEASSNLARFDGVKYGYRAPDAKTLTDMYKTTRSQGFGVEVKRRIMLGTYVLSSGYYDAYYLKAARIRTLITQDFEKAFDQCDAVFSPVTPTPALRLGEKCDDPLQMYLTDIYTVSANLAGIPGISVPCGLVDGLPVGAQFMSAKWREDVLLKVGFAVQEEIKKK